MIKELIHKDTVSHIITNVVSLTTSLMNFSCVCLQHQRAAEFRH